MSTAHAIANDTFSALAAAGPQPGQAERMTLYDALIGDWDLEAIDHLPDGTRRVQTGEVHFAWVLEGRAVQDVWIVPARAQRGGTTPGPGNRYGTTLRIYDPADDVWRVTWFNPVTGMVNHLTGRRRGDEIFQEGTHPDDRPIRWIFSDVTPDSFHWRGEVSDDGGKTWRIEAEFFGQRHQ